MYCRHVGIVGLRAGPPSPERKQGIHVGTSAVSQELQLTLLQNWSRSLKSSVFVSTALDAKSFCLDDNSSHVLKKDCNFTISGQYNVVSQRWSISTNGPPFSPLRVGRTFSADRSPRTGRTRSDRCDAEDYDLALRSFARAQESGRPRGSEWPGGFGMEKESVGSFGIKHSLNMMNSYEFFLNSSCMLVCLLYDCGGKLLHVVHVFGVCWFAVGFWIFLFLDMSFL